MKDKPVKIKRRIQCEFCDRMFKDIDGYASHLETKHKDQIPPDMIAKQFHYYLKTGKTYGNCVMCKTKTTWNESTNKYNRFCDNPKCKDKYREIFKQRMMGKYGKISLLDDPEQQKIMLANRRISGRYLWSNREGGLNFTGSYEEDFLRFLDEIMEYHADDIMAPSPHTYYYVYEGKRHFYIPDFFIPSLNLEIEIKDGGDNENKHHKIQAVDKVKEKLKDEVIISAKTFNYVKIVNKEYMKFFLFLEKNAYNVENGKENELIFLP